MRLLVLIKKNLLRFIRNPKAMGFLIIIPIAFYSILGLIFGGISFEDTTTTYNIGWLDNDSTNADYKYHPYYNLNSIHEVLNDTEAINLLNYTSVYEAGNASLAGEIVGFVYFPPGFEEYLENKSKIRIGFWNDDSPSSLITGLFFHLAYSNSINFNFTDITEDASQILSNFDNYDYDAILIINKNFAQGILNNENVNMTYLYRERSNKVRTISKNLYINNTLQFEVNKFIKTQIGSESNATIINQGKISGSTPFESELKFEMYFTQTISPALQITLENIIYQVISGIINNKPEIIELDYQKNSLVGQTVNSITYNSPGYILYGPLTILSFALVILTGEKKEGIYKRLSSTEVKNWEIILSSIISNILLVFMQFGIGAIILTLFGWNPVIYSLFDAIFGVVLTMFLFSFFLLALAFALAPIFKDPDSAGGGVWIILIPLSMISGIFVPVEFFGEGMKIIASVLPTRFAVVALQNLLLNGLSLSDPITLFNLGLLLLYSSIIFVIGIIFFNRFKR